jgi:hypothetical protein
MIILEESKEIKELNEMFVKVEKSLPEKIENSIYYPKLKQLLHLEIARFTKEKLELKADLNFLRMNVGEQLSDTEIKEYLDSLKLKYNSENNDIGIDYHVEVTRFDYGVAVFVVIKRDIIYMKKFVFRFRKSEGISAGLQDVSQAGIPKVPLEENFKERRDRYLKLMGDKK